MGALIGLALGLGLLLVVQALAAPSGTPAQPTWTARLRLAARSAVAEAGLGRLGLRGLTAWCLGVGAAAFLMIAGLSRSQVLASAFGLIAGYAPIAYVRARGRRRRDARRAAWPDVVDDLASAVRAGQS